MTLILLLLRAAPFLSGADRLSLDEDAIGGERRAPPDDAEEDESGKPHQSQRDRVRPAAAEAGGPRRQQTHLPR